MTSSFLRINDHAQRTWYEENPLKGLENTFTFLISNIEARNPKQARTRGAHAAQALALRERLRCA